HHVRLARRGADDGPHPVDVHPAGRGRHELDAAAAGGHGEDPQGVAHPPGEHLVEHAGGHRESGDAEERLVERVLEARPVVDRPHTHSSAPFRMAQAQPSISTPTKVPTATSPAVPTSRTIVPQGRMSAASMSKRTKNRATT